MIEDPEFRLRKDNLKSPTLKAKICLNEKYVPNSGCRIPTGHE